jgi:hypothetical protein
MNVFDKSKKHEGTTRALEKWLHFKPGSAFGLL